MGVVVSGFFSVDARQPTDGSKCLRATRRHFGTSHSYITLEARRLVVRGASKQSIPRR